MMRFGAYVQEMRKAVAAGKIGRPVSGYAQFTCWFPDSVGGWGQSKKTAGGGALLDMGVHCIDLLQYVLDTKVSQVVAFHDNISFQYDVEDSSTVMLRMENGVQCVVQTNFNIPDDAAKWRLEFFGDEGRLIGDTVIGQVDGGSLDAMFLGTQGAYNAQQDKKDGERTAVDVEFGNMYTREIASFSNSILTGLPVEVPGEDAVQIQRIIEAAYRSNDEKRVVEL